MIEDINSLFPLLWSSYLKIEMIRASNPLTQPLTVNAALCSKKQAQIALPLVLVNVLLYFLNKTKRKDCVICIYRIQTEGVRIITPAYYCFTLLLLLRLPLLPARHCRPTCALVLPDQVGVELHVDHLGLMGRCVVHPHLCHHHHHHHHHHGHLWVAKVLI